MLFVFGVANIVAEMMENTVFIAYGFNFVKYFMSSMHYSPATAANMVTNFMGTSFLLTLFGGFIADSFLTHFTTFIISCCMELVVIKNFIKLYLPIIRQLMYFDMKTSNSINKFNHLIRD